MGVRVVFPDMGKDPSIQLIEKTITENGTYDAITDGANGYSKVNVNVEGGGGGGESDFSTAELTLTRGDSNDGRLYAPYLMASPVGTSLFSILNDVEGTNTYEVVVYSGGTVLMYDGTHTVAVSGDIQAMGIGTYLITGDCTITIQDNTIS